MDIPSLQRANSDGGILPCSFRVKKEQSNSGTVPLVLSWHCVAVSNRRIIGTLLAGLDGHNAGCRCMDAANRWVQSATIAAAPLSRRFTPLRQTNSVHPCAAPSLMFALSSRPALSPSRGQVGAPLFTKAYAIVNQATPQLRRCYLSFPTPHLYQHPTSVASIAIGRPFDEEDAVFFAHLADVETRNLANIDDKLRQYKTAAIDSISTFRRTLRVTRLPWPLHRCCGGRHSTSRDGSGRVSSAHLACRCTEDSGRRHCIRFPC